MATIRSPQLSFLYSFDKCMGLLPCISMNAGPFKPNPLWGCFSFKDFLFYSFMIHLFERNLQSQQLKNISNHNRDTVGLQNRHNTLKEHFVFSRKSDVSSSILTKYLELGFTSPISLQTSHHKLNSYAFRPILTFSID